MKNNPYTHYYLEQQGRGMPVFRGSPWQMGHDQKGYGLGALFRSVTRSKGLWFRRSVSQCHTIRHTLCETWH